MAKTTASQSSHESEEIWVLRVGVARDRQIVEERLVNFGQSVTIGSLQSNLFSVPGIESITGERYELFQYRNDMYHFLFTDQMSGMIQISDSTITLDALRNGDSVGGIRAVEKRGVYQVSLPEMCKGKVEIGEYGFLFQSVSTPAVVVQHKKDDDA